MNSNTLEASNYVVTNRIFVFLVSVRVLFGYFRHDGIGDYVASPSDIVGVGLAKEFIQRV
jgi:hypothetical protein